MPRQSIVTSAPRRCHGLPEINLDARASDVVEQPMQRLHRVEVRFAREVEPALEAAAEARARASAMRAAVDDLMRSVMPRKAREVCRVARLRHDQRAVDDRSRVRLAPEREPLASEIADDGRRSLRPRIRAQSSHPPSGSNERAKGSRALFDQPHAIVRRAPGRKLARGR